MAYPPTSQLPAIKRVGSCPVSNLQEALEYLHRIYNPPVRGSRRRTSAKSDSHKELDHLRTDAFERAYSINWLTALISQLGEPEDGTNTPARDTLIETAAALLAVCAGTASAGVITRQFAFDSSSGSQSVMVNLKDVPLDNQDYGSVGAQTWGGACIMAETIVENPAAFGLLSPRPFRCLELGAGTGLVSLTIAKVLQGMLGETPDGVDIVATDFYPSVLANLGQNIQSNFHSSTPQISSLRLDWSEFCSSDPAMDPDVLRTPFDIVYGADIVYEAQHATWIKGCVRKVLRRPSSSCDPTFHLIIPLRATHTTESDSIESVFGSQDEVQHTELVIKHKEIIVCDTESCRDGGEIEYAYYKIGWS